MTGDSRAGPSCCSPKRKVRNERAGLPSRLVGRFRFLPVVFAQPFSWPSGGFLPEATPGLFGSDTLHAMLELRFRSSLFCVASLVLLCPASAAAEVYVAEFGGGSVVDVEPGGDLTGVERFATGLTTPTGMCIGPGGDIYVSEWDAGEVTIITDGGDFTDATPFATGLTTPSSLVCSEDQILVAEFNSGEVTDITAGGDFAAADPFASGLPAIVGLLGTSDGTLYATPQGTDSVYDITGGGDFSLLPPYATGGGTPRGMTETLEGELLVANRDNDTINIFTDGGDMSASVFVSGLNLNEVVASGPTIWAANADADQGAIWNVSDGGDLSALLPHATGILAGNAGVAGILVLPVCGNAIVEAGEDCDESGATMLCNADCTLSACGDGVLNEEAGEACDDGNLDDDDGCSATCEVEEAPGTSSSTGGTSGDDSSTSGDGSTGGDDTTSGDNTTSGPGDSTGSAAETTSTDSTSGNSDGADESTSTGAASSSGGADGAEGETSDGCSCRTDSRSGLGSWGAMLGLLVFVRRRRAPNNP